jgi:hypothetical protein
LPNTPKYYQVPDVAKIERGKKLGKISEYPCTVSYIVYEHQKKKKQKKKKEGKNWKREEKIGRGRKKIG